MEFIVPLTEVGIHCKALNPVKPLWEAKRFSACWTQGVPGPEIKCRARGEDVLDMDVQNITEAARHNH